jgi:hypothetical protein
MRRIEYFAELSVRRACGFGTLAIWTAVVGLSALPLLAAKTAAALTTLMAVILVLKAINAYNKPYRRTELWALLGKDHGLPEAYAQRILMGALREQYIRYAEITGWVALVLWGVSLAISLFFHF